MTPELRIETTRDDPPRVRVAGEVDVQTWRELREHLDGVMAKTPGQVLLDLAAVTFMDSQGLRAICFDPDRVRVVATSPIVGRLLQVTALDTLLLT